jgi:hypothetical protein
LSSSAGDWLDEAYMPIFGAFGTAWNDRMVARRNVSPFGMLWPMMAAAFWPDDRLQHDIAGTLGNGSWGYIVDTYERTPASTTNVAI